MEKSHEQIINLAVFEISLLTDFTLSPRLGIRACSIFGGMTKSELFFRSREAKFRRPSRDRQGILTKQGGKRAAFGRFDDYRTCPSEKYISWIAKISLTTCLYCFTQDGKVFDSTEPLHSEPPAHDYCRCALEQTITILAGTATIHKYDGADYSVKYCGVLPSIYISKEEAVKEGWKAVLGNLDEVLPGTMISGGVFRNRAEKLPDAPYREWYEADVNYTGGYRNGHRLLYSNDGLVFVTYDHYRHFYEIVQGDKNGV